jgi:hypothetical protein
MELAHIILVQLFISATISVSTIQSLAMEMEHVKDLIIQLFTNATISVTTFQSLAKENASMMTWLWTVLEFV